jgi:transposase
MRKIRDVIRLALGERLSLRQVGLSLDLPFTTVGDHVRRAHAAGLSWPLPDELSDSDLERMLFPPTAPSNVARPMPDLADVHRELRRKGVTLELLWLEYREAHPDGYGYTQFVHHYRVFKNHVDVVMRQNHRAGEKLFVDFPGMKIPIYDRRSGEIALHAELFVAVAGASSYLYAEALPSQELLYWISAHVHAFEAMGGCHEIVVCDNLRSGVTRPHRYEPDVNATYAEMAAHYGVAVIPTRTYKPRDKAKVEAGVLLAERWIIARLRHRHFTSLAAANVAIRECVAQINAKLSTPPLFPSSSFTKFPTGLRLRFYSMAPPFARDGALMSSLICATRWSAEGRPSPSATVTIRVPRRRRTLQIRPAGRALSVTSA